MTTRGLVKGLQPQRFAYEPRVAGSTTNPILGAAGLYSRGRPSGQYSIINGWCFGHAEITTGASPTVGAGALYVSLPVTAAPVSESSTSFTGNLGTGVSSVIGQGVLGTAFGAKEQAVTVVMPTAPAAGGILQTPGQWAAIALPPWQLNNPVAATVANGGTSATVTHGAGVTPASLVVTPTSSWQTAGMTQFWRSSVGATTFVINATGAAAAPLSGAMTFDWIASFPGALMTFLTLPNLATQGDHLLFSFAYPIA